MAIPTIRWAASHNGYGESCRTYAVQAWLRSVKPVYGVPSEALKEPSTPNLDSEILSYVTGCKYEFNTDFYGEEHKNFPVVIVKDREHNHGGIHSLNFILLRTFLGSLFYLPEGAQKFSDISGAHLKREQSLKETIKVIPYITKHFEKMTCRAGQGPLDWFGIHMDALSKIYDDLPKVTVRYLGY